MASVTLELPEETRLKLMEKAARKGQPLEKFIRGVLEAEADAAAEIPVIREPPPPVRHHTVEEFNRLLDQLKDRRLPPLPPLPDDFSREDIYCDHD